MRRYRFLPLILLAAPPWGSAPMAETLSPESAVSLALANSPVLKGARAEAASAETGRRVARSGYLPRLDLTEDLVRSTNPVFVFASKLGQENFGPQDFAIASLNEPDAYTNAATRLVLRQNVWDGGRTILGRQAADLDLSAAEDATSWAGEEVAFGAVRAFWDAVVADRMREVAGSAVAAARANRDLAASQVEAGMAVASDRMSAEVRMSEVEAMRIRAEQGVKVSRAAIRQALGLSEDREFDLSAPPVEPSAPAEPEVTWISEALSSRPDLIALGERIRQAEIGQRMARSRFYPEIGVGAQYEWNAKNAFGTTGDNWTVGASLRIPLFDGLENAARMDRAGAEREKLEAMRRELEEGIRLQVRSAYADCVSASQRLEVARAALAQADEALRIVRERYQEGMAVMVELLGAESARTAAQGNLAVAARDLAVARAALSLAGGRSLIPASESSSEIGE